MCYGKYMYKYIIKFLYLHPYFEKFYEYCVTISVLGVTGSALDDLRLAYVW